jgi:uncharacterized membrane protein YeaQ/YmgE (transglycosylase-associated protein family)
VSFIILLIVGAVAGWLGSRLVHGRGLGALGNILVGVVGAAIGGIVFSAVGLAAYGLLAQIISATIGAVILLYVVGLVKRA